MTLSYVLEIILWVMFVVFLALAANARDPVGEMRNLGWAVIILLMFITKELDALSAL